MGQTAATTFTIRNTTWRPVTLIGYTMYYDSGFSEVMPITILPKDKRVIRLWFRAGPSVANQHVVRSFRLYCDQPGHCETLLLTARAGPSACSLAENP